MLSPDKDWTMDENESTTRTLAGDYSELAHAAEPVYDSVLQGTQVLRAPTVCNVSDAMYGYHMGYLAA